MTEQNELVVVEPANIPALFKKDGCDPILKRLHEELDKFEPDVTTAKGRKEIGSFANKFAKAKTLIDGHGKALVEEEKTRLKIVDAERKKFRDECDEMKREARQPLTDWEDAEKERVAKHEGNIQTINDYLNIEIETSSRAKELLDGLKAFDVGEVFEEFELAATKAKESALTQLEAKFIVLHNAEKEKAEADRVEKERLEKEQKEREEKIAKKAADEAREEEKKKAKEKERKGKEERERLKNKALQAKLDKESAEKKAEQDKKEAAAKAEKEREAAVEAEKQRQKDQAESDRKADEKRQANQCHRNKIHKEAKASMLEHGISEEDATMFVTMVKDGLVKHIKIDY